MRALYLGISIMNVGLRRAPFHDCLFSPRPRRKVLYQRAPRNIHRHVVLSEIKEAVAALPPVRSGAAVGTGGSWPLPSGPRNL